MKKRRLFRQVYRYFIYVIIITIGIITLYATTTFRDFFFRQTALELKRNTYLIENQILDSLFPFTEDSPRKAEELCKTVGERGDFRLTIILKNGTVIGDTAQNADAMENHADRPEIRAALDGGIGTHIRYSNTLQQEMMYVAIPLINENRITGVLRSAVSITSLNEAFTSLLLTIAFGGLISIIAATVLAAWLSRNISLPIEALKRGAERFSRGRFNEKLSVRSNLEIGSLADTLNTMASQLQERIETIIRQQSQEKQILATMIEGIVAIDRENTIITINRAASLLLSIPYKSAKGKRIEEIVLLNSLLKFIQKAIKSSLPVEKLITIYEEEERTLETHGSALNDDQGNRFGTLIVIHDITRLRKLEKVRKEFAVNVSHELKTPLTSIKGFVETLLAAHNARDEEKFKHFLSIIAKQTDRVIAIVEDLMSLARIEQEAVRGGISFKEWSIREILISAKQTCESSAAAKNISINLIMNRNIRARINAHLIEQAVVNLIDNAIKYSNNGKQINITLERKEGEALISVEDHGCGIAEEHLPRLFERFYRVDRARSRKMGGTGLGLSIVKHIAEAHDGRVTVESKEGAGSIFYIIIPIRT
ncbi:MAG: HAMP domain-containing protein [Spirochaetales bacterium]|nr:HAMP domain-containing protein [Spirochaetales bacterium]